MDIRELTAADAAAYRELRIEALTNHPDAFASVLEYELQKSLHTTAENLASPIAVTFGSFSEGQLIGNATLLRESGKKMMHRANIVAVYVTPSVRGNGVANSLIKELLDYAQEWGGIEQLYLTVSSHNRPAIRLYERFGFEKYGTELRALKSGDVYTDEDLMVKFL